MLANITFLDSFQDGSSLVVGVYSGGELSASAKKLDADGEIARMVSKIGFSGEFLETASFISANDARKYVLLVGLGKKDRSLSNFELQKIGASVYEASREFEKCFVAINDEDVKLAAAVGGSGSGGDDGASSSGSAGSSDSTALCSKTAQSLVAFGALLKSWRFDKYKSKKDKKIKLEDIIFEASDTETAEKIFTPFRNLASAIFLTREVVAEPANVIYPESFASKALELFKVGAEVEILDQDQMKSLGMNALLGVAQGSVNEPRLVVVHWNGSQNPSDAPIAFVGKGVTFDSGGISIKPSDHMEDMRHDMAGAGAVLGLMKAVATNKMPLNVVGVMPLVENMPSGSAQRPGDVVKSMSGQTIEVLNTDAEGRLILADALWYAQDRYKPAAIVDLATLTGAIVVALGHEFAGLFSNSDELAREIFESSQNTGEKVWRLPMAQAFDKGIDSDIADVQNCARPGVRAGSITAAHFLKRFVNGTPWAHIDIAGVEVSSGKTFICSNGATGFGVQLLYDLLSRMAEKGGINNVKFESEDKQQ